MSWDFETDPEFQEKLDWVEEFVGAEVEPLEHGHGARLEHGGPVAAEARSAAAGAGEGGGTVGSAPRSASGRAGYGQVKLALLNEILGRTHSGPIVFGCGAPDSGNTEILAHYGSEELKRRYLLPLIDNQIVSAFSMTEPQGGSDPTQFRTTAVLDGDSWVINGTKWFSSHANFAAFLVVLAVTDPDAAPHRRMSMFIVPADTPGVEIIRNVPLYGDGPSGATHSYIKYDGVRIPADHLLGERGGGFVVAQTRLGGGRIHHAMRTVGLVKNAFAMMCERALSRTTKGEPLANKQLIQELIADSWIEIEQFRLLVLRTAWRIDKYNDYLKVRADISAVKAAMPAVLRNVAGRALQIHGSLGVSDEMPFGSMVMESYHMGLVDGATEVHKTTVARQVLRDYAPTSDLFPTRHLPRLREQAQAKYGIDSA